MKRMDKKYLIYFAVSGYLLIVILTGIIKLLNGVNNEEITPVNESPVELTPCEPFFKDLIAETALKWEDENLSALDSLNAWQKAELFMSDQELFKSYLRTKQSVDTLINEKRKLAFGRRFEIIKASRTAYYRFQQCWGDKLSGFGDKNNAVFICEKGIVLLVGGKFYFFDKAALKSELTPKDSREIIVFRSTKGHWLPSIKREDSQLVPLTYFGELSKNL